MGVEETSLFIDGCVRGLCDAVGTSPESRRLLVLDVTVYLEV